MAKKAVLIGCNYPGTKAQLKGCINDVKRMHRCLIERFGFRESDITILIDTDRAYTQPTGANVRRAIKDLIGSAESGDCLFIHYSGHGVRLPAETGEDDDTGYDECIVPCDMNLITDEDFKEFVEQVPHGCRITIVSDSCHSGGLIEEVKEQIGESHKNNKNEEESSDSKFGFKSFLKKQVNAAIESRGFHIPHDSHHHRPNLEDDNEFDNSENTPTKGSRSLPLSTLIEILQQKTGKQNIDVGNIRPTLFDMFGKDSSPKIKKFMNVLFDKLQHGSNSEGGGGGFMSLVGGLAQDFLKQQLEANDEEYVKPALETKVHNKKDVYAGAGNRRPLPESGILISGCQSDQTSADANPPNGEAYGALSNAVQIILADVDGEISNREVVLKARKLLAEQGMDNSGGKLVITAHNGVNGDEEFVALDEIQKSVNISLFTSSPKYDYLYCGSPLYGNLSPLRVREWIAYHAKLFGDRSHFIIHDSGGVHSEVIDVLKPWIEKGFMTLQEVKDQERFDGYYHNQFLVLNDCLHRYKFDAKWMFFFDLDEFIYVDPRMKFDELMHSMLEFTQFTIRQIPLSSSLCLEFDRSESLRMWGIEKFVYKDVKRGKRLDQKYAIQPRNAFSAGVHLSQNFAGKSTVISEEKMKYYHYHGGLSNRKKSCRSFVNESNVWYEGSPYVRDVSIRRMVGSVKSFESKTIGNVLVGTKQ